MSKDPDDLSILFRTRIKKNQALAKKYGILIIGYRKHQYRTLLPNTGLKIVSGACSFSNRSDDLLESKRAAGKKRINVPFMILRANLPSFKHRSVTALRFGPNTWDNI
jgi:hypothetical protein